MDSNDELNSREALLKVMKKVFFSIVLFLIVFIFIFEGFEYFKSCFFQLQKPEKIRNLVMSYGKYSVFAFIALQIFQVVVFFIPGEIVQIAGGYIYGVIKGSIISLTGITIGSLICFFISCKFGKAFVKRIISKNRLKYFEGILKYKKIKYIVFILYLIPGIPKDAAAYICGISDIKLKDFFIFSTLGRLPGIIISAYFGDRLIKGDLSGMAVIAVIMTILFIIGVLSEEKIIIKINKRNQQHG